MKLFLNFIKEKVKIFLLFLIFSLLVIVSNILFGLPISVALYPISLCLIVGIIFVIIDFSKYKKKHSELKKIAQNCSANIIDTLEDKELIGKDYCEIIKSIVDYSKSIEDLHNKKDEDTFLYYSMWAHQIKTPIASLKLSLQCSNSDENRELLTELSKIERYVEMVLSYIKLDKKSSDFIFREYDIDELICKTVKNFASDFINKKLYLKYESKSRIIVTDEKWFCFVLEQILSNAIKYTKDGGITIDLQDNLLKITDTGIGIYLEDLPRIFDMGYTGINGRIDKKASGIGLYLTKRVCDMLSIGININSNIGVGTEVLLDLTQNKYNKE